MKGPLRVVAVLAAFASAVALGAAYPLLARPGALLAARWERWPFAFALLLVPLALYAGTFRQDRRRPMLRLGSVAPLVAGPRGVRTYLRDLPGVLRAAALVFLVGALCRPVNVRSDERAEDKGIDVVIAMDLSGSSTAIPRSCLASRRSRATAASRGSTPRRSSCATSSAAERATASASWSSRRSPTSSRRRRSTTRCSRASSRGSRCA